MAISPITQYSLSTTVTSPSETAITENANYSVVWEVSYDNAATWAVIPDGRGADSNSALSLNSELQFDKLFGFRPKQKFFKAFDIDLYLFGDVGSIIYENQNEQLRFSRLRADMGIGSTLSLKKFWKFAWVKPITVRFDVPFYMSHAPYTEQNNFKFRWVMGVNRAF